MGEDADNNDLPEEALGVNTDSICWVLELRGSLSDFSVIGGAVGGGGGGIAPTFRNGKIDLLPVGASPFRFREGGEGKGGLIDEEEALVV